MKAAQLFVKCLENEGVEYIFGILVALAGLVVALFRLRLPRKLSFRIAVKRIAKLIYNGQSPSFQSLASN